MGGDVAGDPEGLGSGDNTSGGHESRWALPKVSRVARNAQVVSLASKIGSRWGVHKARRRFARAARREELDREFEMHTAQDVARRLGNMKGAFMKIGQMASYLDQGMPDQMRRTLAVLQQDAPPMSHHLVCATLKAELGAEPGEVFAKFDPEPIAAASIGQVHRAVTTDGEAVAVKVQYPGIDRAMASDLANVDPLLKLMRRTFPSLEPKPLVAELSERLIEEVDYKREAANQQLFSDYYRGHPLIRVPEVLDQYSTRRVITSELAVGSRLDEVVTWSQGERNSAAETLYRFTFGSMYQLRAFNGDPHPGNYLFGRGGKVTFLDFGLVKYFEPSVIDDFMALIWPMVIDDDMNTYRREAIRQGLLTPEAERAVTDEQIRRYFGHFYEFVLNDGPYAITAEYAAKTLRQVFAFADAEDGIAQYTNLPPNFTVVQRINLGLLAIFGELQAVANWRRIAEEYWPTFERAPSTPLGRKIQDLWQPPHLSQTSC